jgi:GNAT superfamily N-acetyltransferase
MSDMDDSVPVPRVLRVTYLEQRVPPQASLYWGSERVILERMSLATYLALYQRVGAPLRWDQRSSMPTEELAALLDGDALHIYLLRDCHTEAIGFCEFDRRAFPQVELKNFGLVPDAQGRGLGPWLLTTALQAEWRSNPDRIWLHTDEWDHPAALKVYQRAGFQIYDVRDEPADSL